MIRPSNARRNSPFNTRMNPANTTKSTFAFTNAATNARSASSSNFVRKFPGGMNCTARERSRAHSRILASATSLKTMETSAGILPAAHASAIAAKLEPLPEPNTPIRNFCSLRTRLTYNEPPTQTSSYLEAALAFSAFWAIRTNSPNAAVSVAAKSAMILRSSATFAAFKPSIRRL